MLSGFSLYRLVVERKVKKESGLVCVRSSAALMTLKSEMQCLAECSAVQLLAQMLQTAQVYSALV